MGSCAVEKTRLQFDVAPIRSAASFNPAAMALRFVFPAARSSFDDRSEIVSLRVSTRPQGFYAHCTRLLARDYATIAAKLCATTFGGGQCVFGALGNHSGNTFVAITSQSENPVRSIRE